MNSHKKILNAAVIVAALGYFVDVYDLILFSIVRVPSLKDLGLTGEALTTVGLNLLNVQMIGMLLGGIIWGVLGDKRGRISVLFLTILLYSVANILNGMVHTLNEYYVCRFFAGLGLAGELGARAFSCRFEDLFDWRVAYYFGGGMGLMLLVLRVLMYESGMYSKLKQSTVKKGSFLSLFSNRERFIKYLKCILIGVPVWYIIGVLVTLSPEFASEKGLNIVGNIVAGKAVMYHYIGASIGAFLTGMLSQYIKSRKKALIISLFTLAATLIWFFLSSGVTEPTFYFILLVIGIPNGYWSVFVTTASEQFGTNLRATTTTSIPNFVRGATVLVTTAFNFFKSGSLGILGAGIAVGIVVIVLAIYSSFTIDESYHKDLDYFE